MEIFLFLLIFVGLPWFVISLVKSYFENRARDKDAEIRRQAHALNPALKHEEQIRLVVRMLQHKNGFNHIKRGGINVNGNFIEIDNTPVTNKATQIRNNFLNDPKLGEREKVSLMNFLERNLGEKIKAEAINKAIYESQKLAKLEDDKRKKEESDLKNLRRKLIIDKLSGKYSYVLVDKNSHLFRGNNEPFVFKSNCWEYVDGSYIFFGGDSYNQGVINLFKKLSQLKKMKKIRRIDNTNDPRTVG